MMDYVLLYPKREELRRISLGENGGITKVEYPSEAEPGSYVYARVTMVCKMPYGTPWPDRQFIFILVDAVSRKQLDFSNKFIGYPESIHEEVVKFVMPKESIALELQLRWYDPDQPEMTFGVIEDTYLFSVTATLVSLTVRSFPITGVPVKVDGVEQATPAYYEVSKGPYSVIVPSKFEGRDFEKWEDASTDPLRHINIVASTEITAYYEAIEEEIPWYEKYQKELLIGGAVVIGLLLITSR